MAYIFDILLVGVWREHFQNPQGEAHVPRVVGIIETEAEVDAAVVEQVVFVFFETRVVAVFAVEVDTLTPTVERMKQAIHFQ